MKQLILSMAAVLAVAGSLTMSASEKWNPVANPEAVVISGPARFTVLTPEMIRLEWSPTGQFEDRATFTVVNRNLPVPHFTKSEDKDFLYINTDKLKLKYRKGTSFNYDQNILENLTITMELNGKPVTWFTARGDHQNLKGTNRTLDRCYGDGMRDKLENGVVSRSGWAVIDDSPGYVRADGSRSMALVPDDSGVDWLASRDDKEALDLYFMGYGHDYKKALYDYTRIAGKMPLPPDYVFGYWYSKYENYSADEYRDIMKNLKDNDINTDVLILDMDWHWNGDPDPKISGGRGGWTGWTWNTNLIPDHKQLLKDIHDNGMRVGLNLHPADGVDNTEDIFAGMAADLNLDADKVKNIPWKMEDRDFYKAFARNFLRPMEAEGVDFWWLDWQQYLLSPFTDGLGETYWCNHTFFNDMKANRTDRRPMIFHRWGGLGNHRHQIGFSGDTYINFETLAYQPYFTATAANVCYGYWGHDLGGHMSDGSYPVNDPELLLRWFQYGVFSPIFRSHATAGTWINRKIWTYDNFPQLNATVKLRYALFPYIYTMARKSYDTGISICRPLYYEYSEADEAYAFENQYFFGDDIMVAPIVEASKDGVSSKRIWFPEGNWWSVSDNRMIDGGCVRTLDYTLEQIPYFYREGAVIVNNPAEVKRVTERPDRLIINVIAGKDGETDLYEDSGDSHDYDINYATTRIAHRTVGKKGTYTIAARQGSAEGLAAKRGYELRVYNTEAPADGQATVDGRRVKASYDPAARCTIVTIPSAKCDKARTVTIDYN